MTFNPQHLGFAWPVETLLSNPAGEEMVVRPHAVNFHALTESQGRRIEECYRYYTSTHGIISELQIKKWLAGGESACAELLAVFRGLFAVQPEARLTLEHVVSSLQQRGFSTTTIEVNLRWLLQDGYVAAASDGHQWFLAIADW